MQLPSGYPRSTHLRILTILLRIMGVGSLITAAAALFSLVVMSDASLVLVAIGLGCAILGVVLLLVQLPQSDVERMFGKQRD